MEKYLAQVLQKDVGRRLQVGQEIIEYVSDKEKSPDLEQDQTALDRMVDGIGSLWVNSSNFKVNWPPTGHARRFNFIHQVFFLLLKTGLSRTLSGPVPAV